MITAPTISEYTFLHLGALEILASSLASSFFDLLRTKLWLDRTLIAFALSRVAPSL
jgi:hypothetical protein